MARFVFGPVPSRRLGFSLGVDIIPSKHCCFDCIYCQIGRTTSNELVRTSFYDPHKVVEEIIDTVDKGGTIDHISFSGSGEPTLNADLGIMIKKTKEFVKTIPIAVITNGALLSREDVREDLLHADVVLPSLDAVSEDMFRYIDRPHSLLDTDTIIKGLKQFRYEYKGQIWLEIMLVKGVNDDKEELKKIKNVITELNVNKVQINTVTRPPTEETTGRLTKEELENVQAFLGNPCEVICSFDKSSKKVIDPDWIQQIPEILRRRSLTLDDIVCITGVSFYEAKGQLQSLENQGRIKSYIFEDSIYYVTR